MDSETPVSVLGRVGFGKYGEPIGGFGSVYGPSRTSTPPVPTYDTPVPDITITTGKEEEEDDDNKNMLMIGGIALVVALGVGTAIYMTRK